MVSSVEVAWVIVTVIRIFSFAACVFCCIRACNESRVQNFGSARNRGAQCDEVTVVAWRKRNLDFVSFSAFKLNVGVLVVCFDFFPCGIVEKLHYDSKSCVSCCLQFFWDCITKSCHVVKRAFSFLFEFQWKLGVFLGRSDFLLPERNFYCHRFCRRSFELAFCKFFCVEEGSGGKVRFVEVICLDYIVNRFQNSGCCGCVFPVACTLIAQKRIDESCVDFIVLVELCEKLQDQRKIFGLVSVVSKSPVRCIRICDVNSSGCRPCVSSYDSSRFFCSEWACTVFFKWSKTCKCQGRYVLPVSVYDVIQLCVCDRFSVQGKNIIIVGAAIVVVVKCNSFVFFLRFYSKFSLLFKRCRFILNIIAQFIDVDCKFFVRIASFFCKSIDMSDSWRDKEIWIAWSWPVTESSVCVLAVFPFLEVRFYAFFDVRDFAVQIEDIDVILENHKRKNAWTLLLKASIRIFKKILNSPAK